MYRSILAVALTVMLVVVGFAVAVPTASAQKTCDPKTQDCGCDPKTQKCDIICHNIGGPRDLGANCDGTGACSFVTTDGTVIDVAPNHFLGIIIGFNQDSPGALNAHLNHGDGFVIMAWDPALHLASTGQNHEASNVECLAMRARTTQPPEPGN